MTGVDGEPDSRPETDSDRALSWVECVRAALEDAARSGNLPDSDFDLLDRIEAEADDPVFAVRLANFEGTRRTIVAEEPARDICLAQFYRLRAELGPTNADEPAAATYGQRMCPPFTESMLGVEVRPTQEDLV